MADELWCALENKLVKFRFYFINIYTRFSTPEELIPSALWRSLMSCVRCSQKRKDAQTRAAASSFSFPVLPDTSWHVINTDTRSWCIASHQDPESRISRGKLRMQQQIQFSQLPNFARFVCTWLFYMAWLPRADLLSH